MKAIARQGLSLAAGVGLLALIVYAWTGAVRAAAPVMPEVVIRNWPIPAQAAAGAMIEKYGPPSRFDGRTLVWFNNGIWKRTIVYRDSVDLSGNSPDDILQQTVGYIVPRGKLAALKRFNHGLSASTTDGELTFVSDSEETNLIALNLADEIVVGKRNVAEARASFARALKLAASGKTSAYGEGLHFSVAIPSK